MESQKEIFRGHLPLSSGFCEGQIIAPLINGLLSSDDIKVGHFFEPVTLTKFVPISGEKGDCLLGERREKVHCSTSSRVNCPTWNKNFCQSLDMFNGVEQNLAGRVRNWDLEPFPSLLRAKTEIRKFVALFFSNHLSVSDSEFDIGREEFHHYLPDPHRSHLHSAKEGLKSRPRAVSRFRRRKLPGSG